MALPLLALLLLGLVSNANLWDVRDPILLGTLHFNQGNHLLNRDEFDRADSLYHGDGWESLNPGYWQVQDGALRRRFQTSGIGLPGWAPSHWFPWHYETHVGKPMPMEFDPSLPFGMIWRRDWKLTGNYAIRIEGTIRALPPAADKPGRRDQLPGYGLMGICFGGESLYESWRGGPARWGKNKAWLESGHASWVAAWRDDGSFGIYDHVT
ncbi:MAG: hypothetical protein GY778_25860, partial [bacterium]|nr:hypothetical protein [bacterium]